MDSLETTSNITALLSPSVDTASPEGVYGIRPGGSFLSEYDASMYRRAYPVLFPYGRGVPCGPGVVDLRAYFSWAMRYTDGRFKRSPNFYFDIFGIVQKREVSQRAALRLSRSSWSRLAPRLQRLSPDDFAQAMDEESRKIPISNSTIAEFVREVAIIRGNMVGSDAARSSMRPDIWGTCIYFGNPWIWLTINPADIHDPIVTYLLDSCFDLEAFDPLDGPSSTDRQKRLVEDPFIAAEYFNIVISAILHHLVGVKKQGSSVSSIPGVLGDVCAYYGIVESQGRGSLHIHLLLWLNNTPTSDDIKALLRTDEFKATLREFIADVVHAHAPGVSEEDCAGPAPSPHPSFRRPPDPDAPDFDNRASWAAKLHMETSQYHVCSMACQKVDRYGNISCKCHAPFATSDDVVVFSNGEYIPIRLIDRLNACNLWIHILALGANGDIKINTNGEETTAAVWYTTNYGTKAQGKSYNTSAYAASVSKSLEGVIDSDIVARGKQMLVRVVNRLNSRQEISAPMMMASMEGWSPSYTSHEYVRIYMGDLFALANDVMKLSRDA